MKLAGFAAKLICGKPDLADVNQRFWFICLLSRGIFRFVHEDSNEFDRCHSRVNKTGAGEEMTLKLSLSLRKEMLSVPIVLERCAFSHLVLILHIVIVKLAS